MPSLLGAFLYRAAAADTASLRSMGYAKATSGDEDRPLSVNAFWTILGSFSKRAAAGGSTTTRYAHIAPLAT